MQQEPRDQQALRHRNYNGADGATGATGQQDQLVKQDKLVKQGQQEQLDQQALQQGHHKERLVLMDRD